MDKEILNNALAKIFDGIDSLRSAFPKKKFTIDGRLVGDIGEAIAERDYELELYSKLKKGYDAVAKDNRKVQIKATFKEKLTLKEVPDYYLGLKLSQEKIHKFHEMIYNTLMSANSLLENLLEWSRSQTGRISYEPSQH